MRTTCTSALLLLAAAAQTTNSFAPLSRSVKASRQGTELNILADIDAAKTLARKGAKYSPGGADTELARRFGDLVGAKIKTVAEAFADFTKEFGYTINPLYKNMITDLVGTTHLIVVNARFQRDEVWCLGILTALDLLLKNYPEGPEVKEQIIAALFKSVGMDVGEVRNEAEKLKQWAQGKTRDEIESALSGEGDGPLSSVYGVIQSDEYWMYSRYFGIGLVSLMEGVGVEMDKDVVYPIMEDWMTRKLKAKSHLTACADSDLFFRLKENLDMMETMMKEIEIREKKRMAERLEAKAEAALLAAEKEQLYQAEVAAEVEKVGA